MIKTNVSEILKPIAEEVRKLNEADQGATRAMELQAEELLEMDTAFGTDGKLFIKIYPDKTALKLDYIHIFCLLSTTIR